MSAEVVVMLLGLTFRAALTRVDSITCPAWLVKAGLSHSDHNEGLLHAGYQPRRRGSSLNTHSGKIALARWSIACPKYFMVRLWAKPGSRAELRFHERHRRASLAALLGIPASRVEEFLVETLTDEYLCSTEEAKRRVSYSGVFRGGPELYVILRSIQPAVVVETGVGIGYSSSYILSALERNNVGRLVSIDLPNADRAWKLPIAAEPGFLVPQELRARWDLRLGETHIVLPDVLHELGRVDLFFHDSEHTYDTMRFEFDSVYGFLSPGGQIVSDDAMWNTAMLDFAKVRNLRIDFVYHRGGSAPFTVVRKPPSTDLGPKLTQGNGA
jgi:predicted O-methyltransferase YrrM